MLIPWDQLHPDTLHNLIEEFVSRDGTDYGAEEMSLTSKVEQVARQIRRNEVVIVFDHETETCNLMTRDTWWARGRTDDRDDD